ncbi:MAG: sortase [Oscillospiraceae bacterium]|nr:sortase [Oscillospiraceae bacterium]
MLVNKYSSFLTVLLVIILIFIIAALIFFGFRFFGNRESAQEAATRFEEMARGEGDDEDGSLEVGDVDLNREGTGGGRRRQRQYYRGYVMVGTIHIPRTRITYPILERGTNRSLDIAVAIMWPENAEDRLNEPGNVTIMGHNYRNGRFFSNNRRLELGDAIYITDVRGRRVRYTIYRMFETNPEDTSFITRDTNGAREITLSTCTDDGVRRTIVQARAD